MGNPPRASQVSRKRWREVLERIPTTGEYFRSPECFGGAHGTQDLVYSNLLYYLTAIEAGALILWNITVADSTITREAAYEIWLALGSLSLGCFLSRFHLLVDLIIDLQHATRRWCNNECLTRMILDGNCDAFRNRRYRRDPRSSDPTLPHILMVATGGVPPDY
eukprot:GHVU01137864.1.p1 GENE.GHVU01137864.1~~GHVU01137864.1.p1  ORF type:complete len:178 (-),score=13.93 GHVU01137864.1:597-1088(-)